MIKAKVKAILKITAQKHSIGAPRSPRALTKDLMFLLHVILSVDLAIP